MIQGIHTCCERLGKRGSKPRLQLDETDRSSCLFSPIGRVMVGSLGRKEDPRVREVCFASPPTSAASWLPSSDREIQSMLYPRAHAPACIFSSYTFCFHRRNHFGTSTSLTSHNPSTQHTGKSQISKKVPTTSLPPPLSRLTNVSETFPLLLGKEMSHGIQPPRNCPQKEWPPSATFSWLTKSSPGASHICHQHGASVRPSSHI